MLPLEENPMQKSKSTPLERMPYDIMVGIWVGTAVSFSPTGEPVSSGLSRNIIYWHQRPGDGKKGLLHFRQDQGVARTGPVDLQGLIFAEYDLEVEGKQARSVQTKSQQAHPTTLALIGTETRPDVYHFDGKESKGGFHWYNSHYFTSADERHIMGPVVNAKGVVGLIHVQIFTRVAYDVPPNLHRDI
jgi:hypothetical protein